MRAISLLFHDVYESDPAESGFRSDAANRYKLSRADFAAQLDGVARVRSDAPFVFANGSVGRVLHFGPARFARSTEQDPAYAAAPQEPAYAVTVDDGGVSYYTHIADALEGRGWRGHCFVSTDFTGMRGFLDAAQIRELDARGHLIGSHSASHPPRFSALPFDRMVAEWRQSREVLEDILGHAVDVASVPGGYFSSTVARAASEAGIRILFTSEPVTSIATGTDCMLIGRFTIRRGHAPDTAQRFVGAAPWARSTEWITWNAKGVVKPLLGPSYVRIADWLHASR